MLNTIALIFIGFSIISSLLLLAIYFLSYTAIEKNWRSNASCCGLLLGLVGLQTVHLLFLQGNAHILNSAIYAGLLLISAPSFYLFGREVLQFNARNSPLLALHFVPLLLSPFIEPRALTLFAFVLGTVYALRISYLLYALKNQRQRFKLEFLVFAAFALIAVFILCVGLFASVIGQTIFVLAYAALIGLAFAAMVYLLLRFPDITQKTRDAVIASYAASTLKNTDCNALIAKLKQLFTEQKLHRNEELSLAQIATELGLSSHQTSELINTQCGVGFSRLVREYRVEDAKHQLIHEPKASVLSISLSVGFSSQSNFYTAFREIVGQTPAQFRKAQGINSETSDI
jgi:AraC-like DNA-binding protein